MSNIDPPAPPITAPTAHQPPPPTPSVPAPAPASGSGAAGYGDAMGGIEVTTSFFPLAFLLLFFPAKVTINGGAEMRHGWGTRVYPIAAGRHSVTAWCPYLFAFKIGLLTQQVDVRPGQVTAIKWKCPWLVFLPGVWMVLGERPLAQRDLAGGAPAAPRPAPPGSTYPAPPTAAQPPPPAGAQPPPPAAQPPPPMQGTPSPIPAGWQPDPQGQAVYRYWDGSAWTAHTSNGQGT